MGKITRQELSENLNNEIDIIQEDIGTLESNLNLVDNTVTSHLADETQYEAVLINGFTGSVKYSKDGHGNVKLSLDIQGLTTNVATTEVCVLPAGYRPRKIIPIPVNRSNSEPYTPIIAFYLTPMGAVALAQGSNLKIQASTANITGEITYKGV